MRKNAIALIALTLLFLVFCSCKDSAPDSGDSTYEAQTVIIEGLPGGNAEISIAELRSLPQHEIQASYQRTTGMMENFHMKGPYLSDIINTLGGELSDYEGVGVMGSDSYYCLISREVIQDTPELMLALTIDGSARLDDDTAPARLAVQGQFGPYWVKMVDRIILYTDIPEKEITSVWAFDSLIEGIEPYMYEYYGSKDASIELEQIFSRLDYVDSRSFFTMKSSDGFKKNEIINTVKSRYYIKFEGEDAPTNISPYVKLGMNVHHIAWFSTSNDAVIFLDEMLKYMDVAKVGRYTGIPLDEVMYEVGVSTLRGQIFQAIGVNGERVVIPGEDLSMGVLAPGLSGSIRVAWQPECGYDDIESLMCVKLFTGDFPEEDGSNVEANQEPPEQSPDPQESGKDQNTDGESADNDPQETPVTAEPSKPMVGSLSSGPETVLTVGGNGVERTLYFSLEDLKKLNDGYVEEIYSTANNWPTKSFDVAKGIDLRYLLDQVGIISSARSIKAESVDGYYANFTRDQLLGTRYRYPNLQNGSTASAVSVRPMIAWSYRSDTTDLTQAREDGLRLLLGQNGLNNANTAAMVKQLTKITVSTNDLGQWPQAAFNLENGLLTINHDFMDQVKIYYTLDGTDPSVSSPVYNPSTTYFQPQLIQPIPVEPGMTVKAIAVGFGRWDSAIAAYSIESQISDDSELS